MLTTEFEPYISMVSNIEFEPYISIVLNMLSNIEPEPYINTIIALLGVAYPILLQATARLGENYESENMVGLFKKEREYKAFKWTLFISLILVGIWSLKRPPLIEIEGFNGFIENSAVILVALSTALLVISFLCLVKKILVYYTPHDLRLYLIKRHRKSKNKTKYFSALSDLLLLSIKKQQTKVLQPLPKEFIKEKNRNIFSRIRKIFSKDDKPFGSIKKISVKEIPPRNLSEFFCDAFKNIHDKANNNPVLYPDIYYETVYRAIEALAILKEKQYYNLEYNTSGAIWFLGSTKGKEIHERTYTWLWANLRLAIRYQRDDLIMLHWETCHQYYSLRLPLIHTEYNSASGNVQVSNQEAVDKRNTERERFIEFHYALGGLLVHKERYDCINRIFNYTQSNSSSSVLLPKSMDEIFNFFIEVSDPYDRKHERLPQKYPFPDLEGMNSYYGVKQSIMSYMAILFLRQYHFKVNFSSIPSTQVEIRQWIEGLNILKELVTEHLKNETLLKTLKLDFITPEWCEENKKPFPTDFIDDFKKRLEKKI